MAQLYRHFDENNQLLYVGISLSHLQRLSQHACNSEWADRIVRVEVEHFDSIDDARLAEDEAINKENPIFNKKRRSPYDPYISEKSTADFEITIEDLRTIESLIAENPELLNEPMLRWQLRHRFKNGLARYCISVGRKIMISKSGYARWLSSYAGKRRGRFDEAVL